MALAEVWKLVFFPISGAIPMVAAPDYFPDIRYGTGAKCAPCQKFIMAQARMQKKAPGCEQSGAFLMIWKVAG